MDRPPADPRARLSRVDRERPHPPLVDLDRAVADGAGERGVTQGVEQRCRQRALARTVLDDDERIRTPKRSQAWTTARASISPKIG